MGRLTQLGSLIEMAKNWDDFPMGPPFEENTKQSWVMTLYARFDRILIRIFLWNQSQLLNPGI